MARALGVLTLCGGSLAGIALLVPLPAGANSAGIAVLGVVALVAGIACVVVAERAGPVAVHLVFAGDTGAICLGVQFSDATTGAYAFLLVWLVVIAASYFSARAIAAHVAWILVASGVALATSDAGSTVSPFVHWALGSLMLVVAGAVMSQIVAGRRAVEGRLREEIAANEHLQRELEHQANHDPLTGLANRRRFQQVLSRELVLAARTGTPLCVVALDLDEFKAYNDAEGHPAGDSLLKQVASTWTAALRSTDLIARMGGDEFVALLLDCPRDEADRTLLRLRRDYPVGHTFSAGVACWDGEERAEHLLSRADAEMYLKKAAHRL